MRTPARIPRPIAATTFAMVLATILAACGGPSPTTVPSPSPSGATGLTLIPIVITSPAVVGENRFLFSYVSASDNKPAASPDRSASIEFIPEGETDPVETAAGRFVWGIEDVAGIYVARVTLPSAGAYTARFSTSAEGTAPETANVSIDVLDDAPGVGVGDPAPPSETLTLADVGGDIDRISTDESPDPRFYETSIADALAANEPFVVAFATPAFCQTAQCGPTLDLVKRVVAAYPDLTVINVEPYQLEYVDSRLQPVMTGDPPHLTPVAAVEAWGLRTEPWVFVVDGGGIVRASLELIFAEEELRRPIDEVLAEPASN